MNKINKGIERFWLLVCIAYALFLVYEFIFDKTGIANFYLIFFILPIGMYLFRRQMRLRMEKNMQKSKREKKSTQKTKKK